MLSVLKRQRYSAKQIYFIKMVCNITIVTSRMNIVTQPEKPIKSLVLNKKKVKAFDFDTNKKKILNYFCSINSVGVHLYKSLKHFEK